MSREHSRLDDGDDGIWTAIPLQPMWAIASSSRQAVPPPDDQPSPARQSTADKDDDGFTVCPDTFVEVAPSQDRMVKRKLRGINLSMIAVSATLGSGLYWTGGQMVSVGGPLAAPLSFLLVGLLVWAVMQCLTEMLCIWPIPGALSVYVSEFVDFELGLVNGISYWFTYSVSFAGLIDVSVLDLQYWMGWMSLSVPSKISVALYLLLPLAMILVNSFEIGIYGWLEVVGSSIKIACLVIVVALVGAVMTESDENPSIAARVWRAPLAYDTDVANSWVTTFVICLSTATFAYVGVEVVAAAALEARWPDKKKTDRTARPGAGNNFTKTVKFSSVYISIFATVAYTLAALLAALNIERNECRLPRLSWIDNTQCHGISLQRSIFVIIAERSANKVLKHVINAIVVFSVLTCANTNLYVASRTLFGLTTRLDGTGPFYLRVLAWFGRTNRHKVPIRAMIFSALAFIWVPFLRLSAPYGPTVFVEVLTKMCTGGVIPVWACECWAFIRFYHCISKHREALKRNNIGQVRRWDPDDDYPYRSHAQPFMAYVALTGCLLIIIVANGAFLWSGDFHVTPFLSFFLQPLVFLAVWVLLKLWIHGKWSLVDLSNEDRVLKKIKNLHDIRQVAI
ncbi:hypothetical protein XA68_15200 [Ophiocordyceps unilateralis]|uniref:Amino acid permease/ SLC12A domain-containing protein n=1 Tax=Ophiocordyceps unilateralis TaxID=268505 RepID=A0A2A9P815_OPHUN|nr:hypothetical protein XA68_15200 [Ophiocordyceps unilateralis]